MVASSGSREGVGPELGPEILFCEIDGDRGSAKQPHLSKRDLYYYILLFVVVNGELALHFVYISTSNALLLIFSLQGTRKLFVMSPAKPHRKYRSQPLRQCPYGGP